MKLGDIVYLKEKYESSDGYDTLNIDQGYEIINYGNINSIVYCWIQGNTVVPTKLLMSYEVYKSLKRDEKIDKLIEDET